MIKRNEPDIIYKVDYVKQGFLEKIFNKEDYTLKFE